MKPRVLLDMDGVIANFYYGFSTFLNENYNCTLNPNIEPENYPFEDWGHGIEHINFDEAVYAWLKQDGFKNLPSYDGAKEFVTKLMDTCSVYIVTARVGDWNKKFKPDVIKKIKQDTREWLEAMEIPTERLYFRHDKIPFCQENGISIMFEDKFSTALDGAKNGIHTVLMDRGYNGSQINRFRIYRVFSFDEALNQLEKMIKQ